MKLSLSDSQIINELADLLYLFLPGQPHPFADQTISFAGIANDLGLSNFWIGGSKTNAIIHLLGNVLINQRDKFCELIIEIVQRGLRYRSSKNNSITKEEIVLLNQLVEKIGFKIPELWDEKFLETFSTPYDEETDGETDNSVDFEKIKDELLSLSNLQPQPRGYAFEKFLDELFNVFDLKSKPSFKLIGEQIDGSFQLDDETYLVEARWQNAPVGQSDLLAFYGKVAGKATWSRGLFISYSGFTKDGLSAFSKGKSTNIVGMDGKDLCLLLENKMSLYEAIRSKTRRAAETGDFYVSVYEFFVK